MKDKPKAIKNYINVCFNCLKETDVYRIYIPSLGYGSYFDGRSTYIHLCDRCFNLTNAKWWELEIIGDDFRQYKYEEKIFDFVKNMPIEGQELFFNRCADGWNVHYMQPQDWIDYKLGILSHKKCKEYELYSPDEKKAYKLKFPTCQHPVNLIFNNGSKSCWCPFGSHGEYGQKVSLNICEECYECKYYTPRIKPIKEIQDNDWKDYQIYYIAKLKEDEYKRKFED